MHISLKAGVLAVDTKEMGYHFMIFMMKRKHIVGDNYLGEMRLIDPIAYIMICKRAHNLFICSLQ